jgi:hypothetical protein
MKDNIKQIAKIGAKSAFKFLIVIGLGSFLTLLFAIIIFFQNSHLVNEGIGLFQALLNNNPLGLLIILGSPIFIGLYVVVANKITIQSLIYMAWNSKVGEFITNRVEQIIAKVTDGKNWVGKATSASLLRAKLLQANQNDENTSKVQRKIIGYGFQKMSLDGIDFQDENTKLSSILSNKFQELVSDMTEPSFMLFWILLGIQTLCFVGAMIYS